VSVRPFVSPPTVLVRPPVRPPTAPLKVCVVPVRAVPTLWLAVVRPAAAAGPPDAAGTRRGRGRGGRRGGLGTAEQTAGEPADDAVDGAGQPLGGLRDRGPDTLHHRAEQRDAAADLLHRVAQRATYAADHAGHGVHPGLRDAAHRPDGRVQGGAERLRGVRDDPAQRGDRRAHRAQPVADPADEAANSTAGTSDHAARHTTDDTAGTA